MKKFKISKTMRNFLILIIFGIIAFCGFKYQDNQKYENVEYTEFLTMVSEGEVDTVIYSSGDNTIKVINESEELYYLVENPQTDTFREELLLAGVSIETPLEIPYSTIMMLVYILLIGFMVKGVIGQLGGKNLSSMNSYKVEKMQNITLNNVACNSEVKKEMLRIIDFLKRKNYYLNKGAKVPNGILMYGPPGTGKTLLAKAVAKEAECSFYALAGSDFIEMYAGRGASRVRDLFKSARENAPSIIFIDELDAIGGARSNGENSKEGNQTLNALLSELDGFESKSNVIVIGATNRLDSIDPALLRGGRFGKQVSIPLPRTKEERLEIINIHKVKDSYDETVDFDAFANKTRGLAGADIASILNEALLIAIKNGQEKVDNIALEKAFNQILLKGHKSDNNKAMSAEEQLSIAYHEAGHALLAKHVCGNVVSAISITGTTSGMGGYTISLPEEEKNLLTAKDLENQVVMLYAGRAAEKVGGFEDSVGASNDIQRATNIIKAMYTTYGMNGNSLLNHSVLQGVSSEKDLYQSIKEKSDELYKKAEDILTENKVFLRVLAEKLIEVETLEEKDFEELYKIYY